MRVAVCTGTGAGAGAADTRASSARRLVARSFSSVRVTAAAPALTGAAAGGASRPEMPTARPAPNTTVAATACIQTGVDCRHHGTDSPAAVPTGGAG